MPAQFLLSSDLQISVINQKFFNLSKYFWEYTEKSSYLQG